MARHHYAKYDDYLTFEELKVVTSTLATVAGQAFAAMTKDSLAFCLLCNAYGSQVRK